MLLSDFATEKNRTTDDDSKPFFQPFRPSFPTFDITLRIPFTLKANPFFAAYITRLQTIFAMHWVPLAFQHYSASCPLRYFHGHTSVFGWWGLEDCPRLICGCLWQWYFSDWQVGGFEELDGFLIRFQPFGGQSLCINCPPSPSLHKSWHCQQSNSPKKAEM